MQRSWAPVRTGAVNLPPLGRGLRLRRGRDRQRGPRELNRPTTSIRLRRPRPPHSRRADRPRQGSDQGRTADKTEMDAITAEDELDDQLSPPRRLPGRSTPVTSIETGNLGRVDSRICDRTTEHATFTYRDQTGSSGETEGGRWGWGTAPSSQASSSARDAMIWLPSEARRR